MQRLEFIDLAIVSPAPIVALTRKSRKQSAAELAKNIHVYAMYSLRSTSSLLRTHSGDARSRYKCVCAITAGSLTETNGFQIRERCALADTSRLFY